MRNEYCLTLNRAWAVCSWARLFSSWKKISLQPLYPMILCPYIWADWMRQKVAGYHAVCTWQADLFKSPNLWAGFFQGHRFSLAICCVNKRQPQQQVVQMLALKHRVALKPTELAINGVCIFAHLAKVEVQIMSYSQLTYTWPNSSLGQLHQLQRGYSGNEFAIFLLIPLHSKHIYFFMGYSVWSSWNSTETGLQRPVYCFWFFLRASLTITISNVWLYAPHTFCGAGTASYLYTAPKKIRLLLP